MGSGWASPSAGRNDDTNAPGTHPPQLPPPSPPTQSLAPQHDQPALARGPNNRRSQHLAGMPIWVWTILGLVVTVILVGAISNLRDGNDDTGSTPSVAADEKSTISSTTNAIAATDATVQRASSTAEFSHMIRNSPTVEAAQDLLDETVDQVADGDYETGARFADLAAEKYAELTDEAAAISDGSEAADTTIAAFVACETAWRNAADTLRASDPEQVRDQFETMLDDCNDQLAMSRVLLDDAERND